MAFISGCPRCQKPFLVPEGHGHDAVVQCPACFAEYSLGEILTSIPALIVVHPGGGAAAVEVATPSLAEIVPPAEPELSLAPVVSEDGAPAAELVEPALGDSDALDFIADAPAVAAAGDGSDVAVAPEADHAADALFAAAFAEEVPPPGEPGAAPVPAATDGEGHASLAGAGDKADDWGGDWGGFDGKAAPHAVADDTIDLAAHEESEDGGLAHIDFAAITGTSQATATAAGETAAMAFEPPKKKRRKREANPVVRIVGMAVAGLLAFGCVYLIAVWRDIKLPEWLQFNRTVKQTTAPKLNSAPAPNKAVIPATGPSTPTVSIAASSADAGKISGLDASPGSKPDVAGKPALSAAPSTAAAGPKTGPADFQAKSKPRTPASDEAAMPTEPLPSTPETEDRPPPASPGKSDIAAPAVVVPVTDKPKPEVRNKPEVTDPFAMPSPPSATPNAAVKPAAAPKIEPPKSEKPNVEPKPETPPTLQPEPAAKPELPNKPETADPFAIPDISTKPPAAAPKIEQPKAEKPKIEQPKIEKPAVESKPELPAPAKPEPLPSFEPPGESEVPKAELPKAEVPKAELLKPAPVAPAPKPEVKPALRIGPLGAPTIPAAQLDSALARIGAAAQPAYGDLCQLAEAATFVQNASAAQKRAIRDALKRLAGDPQEVARLAAEAKKLVDAKTTKGGIALSGKVSKVASKNRLFGTAVRIEGMPNAVMVFSSHPLDVKEGESVIVMGALLSEPAKNLPGYTGKQPVVVWADLAVPTMTNVK